MSGKKILAIIGLVSLAILGVIFISAVAAPEARFEKDVNKLANEYGVGVDRVEIRKSTNPSIKNDDVEIYFTNFDLLEMKSRQTMMSKINLHYNDVTFHISRLYSGNEEYFYNGMTLSELEAYEKEKREANAKRYQAQKEEEERERKEYIDKLKSTFGEYERPGVGMSENGLSYTKLGPPDEVEKCGDFDHYDVEHKMKKYTWGHYDRNDFVVVTVSYYDIHYKIEYPDDNGFVSSVYYKGKDGFGKTIDYYDVIRNRNK